MATGDGLTTAQARGKRLGIDDIYGEVKLADKLPLVEALQREGRIVAMGWRRPTTESRWEPEWMWR